jgi:hypothetical protein
MASNVLIRDQHGAETVVAEAQLLTEKGLHDVLTAHPELVPGEDLDIGPAVVVGRESGLESGYADLVLVDREARLCLVEVKKEGNPDTRRVIAQLLDYAASLWQMSANEFEHSVLHPYLRSTSIEEPDLPDLATFAAQWFGPPAEVGEAAMDADFDEFPDQLGRTLAGGQFRLVVAAPSIPHGVQRVIEYMNSQGLLLYGLEVSFFSGPAECFVPRIVVRPSVTETVKLTGGAAALGREDFIEALPERVRAWGAEFLDSAESGGARLRWNSYGASIRATRSPERVVGWLEKKRAVITVKTPTGYPHEPFTDARNALAALSKGSISADDWYWSSRYEDLADADLVTVAEIALGLVRALSVAVNYKPLDEPITATFQRNDNNLWAKSVPTLADFIGSWLRGSLKAPGLEANTAVTAEPLAGGSPGWRLHFPSTEASQVVWPVGELEGEFQLRVTEFGSDQTHHQA